jgi:hypothetical protein
VSRVAAYVLVLVLGLELAVWEAFLVAARPFGVALPLAAALALVGNVAVGLAGARVLRRPLGAAVPGLVWLAVALTLGSKTAEGDVVVPSSFRGTAFLLVGTAAAAVPVGLAAGRRGNGATPRGETRR